MIPRLAYYHLSPRVTAFSTTRHGGYSAGNYAELNVNVYCGDSAESIELNRKALATQLQLASSSQLMIPHQVHGTEVFQVESGLVHQPLSQRQALLEGIDAVMTDVTALCIGVSTADCIPVLLYDPEHHCAAAVHAGWRGTVARIVQKTLRRMTDVYGTNPLQVRTVIGPGISRKNFEVGPEVYEAFQQGGFSMERLATRHPKTGKWHIDLPLCNRLQLEDDGVPAQNIHDCGICTFDSADDYFSARRLGINSGRIYTGIILR